MTQASRPKTRMKIDLAGHFSIAIIDKQRPDSFYITAHLKESLDPQALQTAVNDLVRRLPFLNGRFRSGFFWYFHEVLENPPQIVFAEDLPIFDDYYNTGDGHVLRVLYGKQHFTIQAIHSIVDGRGLSKLMRALLVRYFEVLGLTVEKGDIVDCSDPYHTEEAEDAYQSHTDFKKIYPAQEKTKSKLSVYHHKGSKRAPQRVVRKTFDLTKIKAASQAHKVTINEYLLAHIFKAFAEERNSRGCKKPIVSAIPIDCRRFLPSKTFRNFIINGTITMPETEDFSDMVQQIRGQFAKINHAFVQTEVNGLSKAMKAASFLPLGGKKLILRGMGQLDKLKRTTNFSNLGRVSLPQEVLARIENLEFVINTPAHMPYSFACITAGEALTLAITVGVEEDTLAEKIMKHLDEAA